MSNNFNTNNNSDDWTVVSHKKSNSKPKSPSPNTSNHLQNISNNPDQDWNNVVFHKNPSPKTNKSSYSSSVSTKKKPSNHVIFLNNLDNQTDAFKLKKVNKSLSQKIINYRLSNNLTQIQLANKLNLKVDIIKSYENASAIPDDTTLNKFNRLLSQQPKSS